MVEPKTVIINDVEYVRKTQVAEKLDGMVYSVVRTYSAGVHIGYVKEFGLKFPQSAVLVKARRLYSWTGACSLSQVSTDGVTSSSRISVEVPEITLTDVIEVIPCSTKAKKSFEEARVWKK